MKTEIIINLVAFVAGLVVQHIYYLVSKKDQITIFNRLPEPAKKAIIKNEVSIKELNDFIFSKSIEEDSDDPLPFKACPQCGNKTLVRSMIEDHHFIRCNKCGWGNDY